MIASPPEGWRRTTVRRVLRPLDRPAQPGLGVITAYRDGVVTLRSNRREDGYTFSDSENGYQEIRPGDVVFHALDGFAGAVGVSDSRGNASPVYHVCEPVAGDDPAFIARLLRHLGTSGFLSTQAPNVRERSVDFRNWSTFARIPLLLPPAPQQRAIADYLDRELARIDTLIEEQQRLIAMLRERRRVVVTRAVCFGVDEKVDLRDSGDPLSGLVPAHWTVKPVRYWLESLDGRRVPLSAEERGERRGDYDYYGASGVIDHVDDYLFDEPLVLVSEDGANLVMRSTPIAFAAKGKYWVNNHAHVLRPLVGGDVDYWSQRLEAIDVRTVVSGSAQPKLTAGALMGLRVSAPEDPKEQRKIAAFLNEQTAKIDQLIEESERFVELSKERRAALIEATVTGQIDVRGVA